VVACSVVCQMGSRDGWRRFCDGSNRSNSSVSPSVDLFSVPGKAFGGELCGDGGDTSSADCFVTMI